MYSIRAIVITCLCWVSWLAIPTAHQRRSDLQAQLAVHIANQIGSYHIVKLYQSLLSAKLCQLMVFWTSRYSNYRDISWKIKFNNLRNFRNNSSPWICVGCVCHFTKWQTQPFISKGTNCISYMMRICFERIEVSPSFTVSCVFYLSRYIPLMVVVSSYDKPRNIKRHLWIYVFKCVL